VSSEQSFDPLVLKAEALAQTSRVGKNHPERPDILAHLVAVRNWLDQILPVCNEPPKDFEVAARWILDNDYQLERALLHVDRDLPPEFFRLLPSLTDQNYHQLPRIYQLVHALLGETRLQLTYDRLIQFVQAYQHQAVLSEAELWAIPALLRIACMENLVCGVAGLLEGASLPFRSNQIIDENAGVDATERVSGSIACIIAVSEIDWHDFVDEVSQIEAVLSADPASVYTLMSRTSRNAYRQEIETLARYSAHTEAAVSAQLIALAADQDEPRRRHIGYWLLGEGRAQFNSLLRYQPTCRKRLNAFIDRHAGALYSLLLLSVALAALTVPALYLLYLAADSWIVVGVLFLSALPASDIAVQFVHWWAAKIRPRRTLLTLDRHAVMPIECQCVVAVPVIVSSKDEIATLVERLELRYLSNTEKYLRFVLLSDLADASEKQTAGDKEIEASLVAGIRQLNQRYRRHSSDNLNSTVVDTGDRFLLLHRSRQFNPSEQCWMGWERKRGKLEQFNTLLMEGWNDAFTLTEGDLSVLKGTKYVISLDADTMLPPGTAADLVCMFEHPLNQPVWDSNTGELLYGYTILQPRIETLEMSESSSRLAHLFSGDNAIDIYSHAVSNFYQDWFGVGSYVGKGIYHVESFHRSLRDRVPENRILSHDLFEGMHGRVALASSIVLYESFPETWAEHCSRRHRWIRGDWQLTAWLGRRVPDRSSTPADSVFTALDKWKLIDNLRRSLAPPILLIYLLSAWSWFPGNALFWTLLALVAFAPYLVNEMLEGLALVSSSKTARGYLHRLKEQMARWLVSIALIIPDALISMDAIVRTLWRQWISGRHLLQWRSAAHVSSDNAQDWYRVSREHLVLLSPMVAVPVAFWLFLNNSSALLVALPVLLAWFTAPALVIWLSAPRVFRRDTLSLDDRLFLRRVARRTWHYFDTFSGPDENWLPPDNYQLHASVGIAHRTSTTNIGLYMSSAVAAYDLGFIGAQELVVRSDNLLDTLQQLPMYRGQLMNWYDTRTLAPLEPRYVSTVDNGNLAICLLALKQGCLEIADAPVLSVSRWQGLLDTFTILREALSELYTPVDNLVLAQMDRLETTLISLSEESEYLDVTVLSLPTLADWSMTAQLLNRELVQLSDLSAHRIERIRMWMERFDHQMVTLFRDVHQLLPWLLSLDDVPDGCQSTGDALRRSVRNGYPLQGLSKKHDELLAIVSEAKVSVMSGNNGNQKASDWLQRVSSQLLLAHDQQMELTSRLRAVASRADQFAWSMDFSWLYDRRSRLFHIGYNVTSGLLDSNHYDLLASEARLASFFAIAKHDVPLEHWFHLGRPIVRQGGFPVLQSWNGSLFEYLMPPLFLPGKRNTLLGESEALAVKAQQAHGEKQGIPWGVSESAYSVTDADENYQYRAFGTPALGIRRGLDDDHVVAPYASMLALGVWPQAAVNNLKSLLPLNALGDYGFIDALDFTPTRLHHKIEYRSVETWMAHHQGMSMIAMLNVLCADLMPKRVLQEPALNAVELLLQERIPWGATAQTKRLSKPSDGHSADTRPTMLSPWVPALAQGVTHMHLLGNDRLSAHISHSGGGGLYYRNLALTRVSSDRSRAHEGYRIHLRVRDTHEQCWLGSHRDAVDEPSVITTFTQHGVEFVQRTKALTIRVEMLVAPDTDLDVRRLTIVNESMDKQRIVLTSFAEVVLAPVAEDERHPAFSKMFIGSRAEQALDGVSFVRRARDEQAATPALLHRMVSDDAGVALTGWETDRHHWFGRDDRSLAQWAVPEILSGTSGWTLDPIMSLQATVTLAAGETKRVSFVTAVADGHAEVLQLSMRFAMPALDRLFTDAPWTTAQEVHRLGLNDDDLPQLQSLASFLLYPMAALRAVPPLQACVLPEQSELWRFGLSGDLPILLIRVHDVAQIEILERLIRAQVLWRRRGLLLDIAVLRLNQAGYEDPLRERIMEVLRDTHNTGWLGRHGGIHLLPTGQVSQRTQDVVLAAAAVVLDTDRTLNERLGDVLIRPSRSPYLAVRQRIEYAQLADVTKPVGLLFDNGIGGFDTESDEYVMQLDSSISTPAPWCNVLANQRFGSLVSEQGLGFTWAQNSGEHRLTPWSNDPVLDRQGEQLWLRDEITGDIWTLSPTSRPLDHPVQVRHGFGYTRWLCNYHGLEQEQLVFVPTDAPVKVVRLRLVNRTDKDRRLTVTYYADWVMEALHSKALTHVVCDYDSGRQAIMARNHWNPEFASSVAFVTATQAPHSVCGNRSDFLNIEHPSSVPDGLLRSDLGGGFTPGSDCCAAYQIHLDIPANEDVEVAFMLGEGIDQAEACALIHSWQSMDQVTRAFDELSEFWSRTCGAVNVRTPDAGFDLLINRWLVYQSVSSRLYARAGFYQAGGAFGFRDQLQDVLCCIPSDPQRVRNQLLLAAEHQFEEGDVLHWWHPPGGRGVRTRISDDYLWLAYVTAHYVKATGDHAVLDVIVPYLKAPLLADDEEDRYSAFDKGGSATVFDHCRRAIEKGMSIGVHGLPLMGTGDWNDGMNGIGRQGRGESVWLAWFQITTIELMIPIAHLRCENELAERWQTHASALKQSIDDHGWDGRWFARAFDDAGKPWGSVTNDECKIDVIAQAWGVLAGFGEEPRVQNALHAADEKLIDHQNQIVRLLTPPFHDTPRNPGYIKAYPPGIRENGGQYTHAAAWLGLAFAGIGATDNAYEVFSMIKPINHTKERQSVQRYAREPYVLAADIGGAGQHTGRGGWSWYTGAASWTWQLGVHGILGIEYLPDSVRLNPGIPSHWDHVEIMLDSGRSTLSIRIDNPDRVGRGISAITVDGVAVNSNTVKFPQESGQRRVIVRLGHDLLERADTI